MRGTDETPHCIVNKFHAIITHIYDNHIKFEVSLDFWQIWPTVWHPYFRTNLETSGNFSKCFVCIGSIFQIGYTLLQRTKAKVTMVIHYLCNKARSYFSIMAKLEMTHYAIWKCEKKIPFDMGKKLSIGYTLKWCLELQRVS